MHARLVTMSLGPGMRDQATALADASLALNRTLPGFVGATYLIFDAVAGEYGSLTVWRSEEEANAAAEKLRPWLKENAGAMLTAPAAVRVAEVYEPA